MLSKEFERDEVIHALLRLSRHYLHFELFNLNKVKFLKSFQRDNYEYFILMHSLKRGKGECKAILFRNASFQTLEEKSNQFLVSFVNNVKGNDP